MSEPTRILVVDDEKNMRTTLTDILTDEGYHVDAVGSGEAAVECCQKTSYDVILMDVRMSGIDGVEAFRRIRRHRQGVRVILMSAYPVEELKRVARDEGAIAFLPKPLNIDSVINLIDEARGTAILVVDDDEPTTTALHDALRGQGYRISVAHSPQDALEMVGQVRFDLVMINAGLQEMNGLELYLAIKQISPTAVAIMMAEMREEFEQIARAAVEKTAYAVIHKPLDFDRVLPLLREVTRQRLSGTLQKPPPEECL